MNQKKIAEAMKMFLEAIGEDVEREGLQETPLRVAKMCSEIFAGIGKEADEELFVCFSEEHEEMVLVKDIPLYSFCEHHLLPFFGKAHVAYIPRKGKLTGLSKLARVVEIYARRPQLQERLTSQIADSIMRVLHPLGVIVVIEAEHLCMTIRGVNKPGCQTLTSAVRGIFRSSEVTRAEALALIRER
jgi:GTP cyclohydrolase I